MNGDPVNGDPVSALASVSIDLDGARHYHAIHGLPAPARDVIVARGLERFLTLCVDHDLRATLFAIGADLKDSAVARLVRQAHDAGHEIASHSHAHRYDLFRRAPAEIEADLHRSIAAIVDVTGARPTGFRAPGYNQSEALFDALEKLGFAYDSSFLAAPLYFAARALALLSYRLRGRRSVSAVGDIREALHAAPFRPRRSDRTQAARSRVEGRALIEVPISGGLGAPFIGTALSLAPPIGRALTQRLLDGDLPIVLELHAIDLCDTDDVDGALAAAQPDARVPFTAKRRALHDTLTALGASRRFATIAEVAASVS